jgi:hypothetical protein
MGRQVNRTLFAAHGDGEVFTADGRIIVGTREDMEQIFGRVGGGLVGVPEAISPSVQVRDVFPLTFGPMASAK